MKIHEKKTKHCLVQAVLVNALFLALVILLFYVYFEGNDDQTMACLVSGVPNNQSTPYLTFINLFIGYPLSLLARAFPAIAWYSVFEYMLVFSAFTGITYVFLRRNRRSGIVLSLLILCSFGFNCYTQMQFTKVAGCCAASGGLLAIDAGFRRKMRVPEAIAGVMLVMIGSCYRYKMALPTVFMLSPLILFFVVKSIHSGRYRYLAQGVLLFGAMLILCASLNAVSKHIYKQNEAWNEYLYFNSYRAQLLDRSFPDYEENVELYDSLGLSDADIQLYDTWDFSDPQLFNLKSVEAMAKARPEVQIDSDYWKTFREKIPGGYLAYPWIQAFLISVALAIYASRKNIPCVALSLFLLFAYSAYLVYYERYLLSRVDLCLFLALSLSLLGLYQSTTRLDAFPSGKRFALCLCAVILLFTPSHAAYGKKTMHTPEQVSENRELTDLIHADKTHDYVVSVRSSEIWWNCFGLWESLPANYMSNVFFPGGWSAYTPTWNQRNESHGIDNLFTYPIDNENVYFMDNKHITAIVDYIKRHYNSDVSSILVKNINGNKIYRIVTSLPQPRIDGEVIRDMPESLVVRNIECSVANKKVTVAGEIYLDGTSSYQAEAFLELAGDDGSLVYQQMTQYEVEPEGEDALPVGDLHGQFSKYTASRSISQKTKWQVSILYHSGDHWYLVYQNALEPGS